MSRALPNAFLSAEPPPPAETAPASLGWNPDDAGATDHIHEIFHFARKLYAEENRFVLDVARFMADIDEPPLFLRNAG